jgi:hypothetical protein
MSRTPLRAVVPLTALAAALTVGIAGAQSSPADGAQAPIAEPGADGKTVSGLTVTPRPRKTCSSRDQECVALVVAELKRLYPEQLKQFCFQEQTKAARTQLTGDQLYDALALAGQHNGPPNPTAFPISAALKTACATDKK